MLSTLRNARGVPKPISFIRSLATEATPTPPDLVPLPLPNHPPRPKVTRLYPKPRPTPALHRPALPKLPPTFGKNQLLPVPNATRDLLESIVNSFDAPIRYAFAYGSGVFEQDGYENLKASGKTPMLDFMFAVTHPGHFHSINMQQHASHYPLHARLLGSSYVSKIEEFGPGVWYHAYVPMNGVVRYFHPMASSGR